MIHYCRAPGMLVLPIYRSDDWPFMYQSTSNKIEFTLVAIPEGCSLMQLWVRQQCSGEHIRADNRTPLQGIMVHKYTQILLNLLVQLLFIIITVKKPINGKHNSQN